MNLSLMLRALTACEVFGDPDRDIRAVTSDSRQAGPGSLFVAYQGVNVDGHRFISTALENGAVAVVGEQDVSHVRSFLPPSAPEVPLIVVPDGREALAWLSAAWYDFPARKLTMIGVTGTDGKTSTTTLLHHVLHSAGREAGKISTINAVIGDHKVDTGLHTTTPDAPYVQRLLAEMVGAGVQTCVLEATSHGLAQHRIAACDFDIAVVTNITHEHLDLHGSLQAYRAAKASLFQNLSMGYRKPDTPKIAVLNLGDSSYDYLHSYSADVRLTYNVDGPGQVVAHNVVHDRRQTRFDVTSPYGSFTVTTSLLGTFNVANILAAASAAMALGVSPEVLQQTISTFRGVQGRLEWIDRGQPFTALVDFAHTPNSLENVLQTARNLAGDRKVIVVFGCAGQRDIEKRPQMGRIAASLADYAILTAEDPRTEDLESIIQAIAEGCLAQGGVEGKTFERVPDRGAALARAVTLASPDDVVIACGKGHEQSMCFGQTEYPWDDRVALAAALEGRPLKTLPTA